MLTGQNELALMQETSMAFPVIAVRPVTLECSLELIEKHTGR